MLKEFNEIYRIINDEMQIEHRVKSASQSSVKQKSEIIDDKQLNLATSYESAACSRSFQPNSQRSVMIQSRLKELKIRSIIEDTNHLPQNLKNMSFLEENLYPINKIGQKVKIFIELAQLNFSMNEQI